MIKRENLMVIAVALFIVGPAILALTAYVITRNPSLRPLGITFNDLVEAGQITDKSLIVAVVDIGTDATNASPPQDYVAAIQTAFARYQVEARVKFRKVPGSSIVSVTYLVDESRIGPYPAARAAEGIRPAAEAERMLIAQRSAVAKETERRRVNGNDGFFKRIFE